MWHRADQAMTNLPGPHVLFTCRSPLRKGFPDSLAAGYPGFSKSAYGVTE
jgi:hypothetical protein